MQPHRRCGSGPTFAVNIHDYCEFYLFAHFLFFFLVFLFLFLFFLFLVFFLTCLIQSSIVVLSFLFAFFFSFFVALH